MRILGVGALVVAAYVGAAQLGFTLAFVAEQVTTVWAPTGIAIGTLLIGGIRLWPAIWLGAFLANAITTAPLWTAFFIATGNTLEAAIAVMMFAKVRRLPFTFERVGDVFTFLMVAAVGCTAISATVGVATLSAAGLQPWERFSRLWLEWWFGDLLGAVLVTPALVSIIRHPWSRGELIRAVGFTAASVLVAHVSFGQVLGLGPHPLEFAIFPIVIGAAAIAGVAVTSLVVLGASVVAIWHTVHGAGPFAAQGVHDGLILLQLFMGVLGATALLLGAAITERRISERRERTAATMLRLAQHAGGVGTFEWDFRRQVAWCSPEFFGIFGLPPGDGVITGAEWGSFVHQDDRERLALHLERALDGTEPAIADYRIVRSDGSVRWLAYSGQLQRTDAGDRLIGTVVDITDRKQLESELRSHADQVDRMNRVKDEFLATLSHELRTPLNAVLGWAHVLREGEVEPAVHQRALEAIERNARAQAQLVDDLLDVSRITTGKLQVKRDAVDLAVVISHAVETMRVGADAKRVNLAVTVQADTPLIVTGDADRLQQVVWNLVSNAIKFTPAGGRIGIELRELESQAEIVVRDSGQGIDPAFLPQLFQRFHQLDASKTRRHGGLGLGLSIVSHLVEAHGGAVDAESDGPNRGSTFRVRLPLRPVRNSETDAPVKPPIRRLTGVKALVVDDEADAREVMRVLLEGRGATVVVASSVSDAQQALAAQQFELLLADIGMPGHDGLTLIRAIRSLPAGAMNRDIRAIAVTAYTSAKDREEVIAAGFDLHVGKPLDAEQLLAAVSAMTAPANPEPDANVTIAARNRSSA